MTIEAPEVWLSDVVAEIHGLLSNLTWDTSQGAYLRGEKVCILLDPCSAEEPGRFHLSATILPLVGRAAALEGTPVVLRRAESYAATVYASLNAQGQVLFYDLEQGSYQTEILIPGDVNTVRESWLERFTATVRNAIAGFLIPTPRLSLGGVSFSDGHERDFERTFRTADGSLVATLWERESGSLELDFQSKDREWDGALLGFIRTYVGSQPQDRPEPRLLFAPLAWTDLYGACRTEVSLGPRPHECGLDLPEGPWPLEFLSPELAGMVGESVMRAATAHTLQAWRRMLDETEKLAPEVRQAISSALER